MKGKNFCGALVTSCCILLVQNNCQDAHWLGPHMTTFFFTYWQRQSCSDSHKEQRGVNFWKCGKKDKSSGSLGRDTLAWKCTVFKNTKAWVWRMCACKYKVLYGKCNVFVSVVQLHRLPIDLRVFVLFFLVGHINLNSCAICIISLYKWHNATEGSTRLIKQRYFLL